MLAMQDKPGLVQEPSVTHPDRRTTINQRGELNLLPTTQIIVPNIDILPSQMTKSQATMVNEATCSTNAVDSLNSNTNTTTVINSMSTLSNDSNNQVMSRPQSLHSNNLHITADTNNGPLSSSPTSPPTSIAATPSTMASTTITTTNNTSTINSGTTTTNSARTAKRTANDYRFGKTIGEGSFSSVYIAQDIHTKKEVASRFFSFSFFFAHSLAHILLIHMDFFFSCSIYIVKVCEKQLIIREKKERYVKREREVMHMLSDTPGFVSLLCTFQDTRNLYFVMTLAKNGDLLPYINKVGSFDFKCTQFYAAELILAIEHMHRKGIVHRDLKPENILLDEKMHTLIADFGSARILDEKNGESDFESRKRTNSFVGTAHYVSPEILKGEQLTKAADLWALGCIIYQMISGLPPFRAGSEYLIFQKILERGLYQFSLSQ